jgi:Tol biopolymer transport system component
LKRAAIWAGPAVLGITAAACVEMPPPEPVPPYTNLTAGADGESYSPSVSDDGRYVVFTSDATNLTGDADNGKSDIFVKDRYTNTLRNLTAAGNGDSLGGVVSGDGSTVAFYSEATNLTADADNGQTDVFSMDINTGVVTNHTRFGDDFSGFPSISDAGDHVAFQSYASNVTLGGDADGGLPDIFAATPRGNVQVTTAGDFFDQPAISGNGITIGFQAYGAFGGTLNEPVVVTVGSVTGVPSATGTYSGELDLSDNGLVPAFRTFSSPNGVIQVGTGPVSDPGTASTDPALTDDGSRVAYTAGDNVVVTIVGGATATVAAGNGASGEASVSGNGKIVAFTSYATDLGVTDGNGAVGDIYVRAL